MAKYIVLDSKFNPTSFQDMIAPYKEYFEKMDKLQEKNEELELASEQAKWLFDEAFAGDPSNPWEEYNKRLEEYADYASKPVDMQAYINKGIGLRRQYIRDIEKMNTAYKLYAADKEQREKELLQDPTRVYNDQRDFNLRAYYDNLNHSVDSASGRALASNISNKAKTKSGSYKSNNVHNINGNSYNNLLIQHFGENPSDMLEVEQALIEWSENPDSTITFNGTNAKAKQDMAHIVINEVSPYKDWNNESFKKLVRDAVVGIYDAVGQDKTQVIANKERNEEDAYRKELIKAISDNFEGDTHQSTPLIFGVGNAVKDFSAFKNNDGTYGWDNAVFKFNPEGNLSYGKTIPSYAYLKEKYDFLKNENFSGFRKHDEIVKKYKDKILYSDIQHDKNIEYLLKNNLPSDTYNNLTVAEAEEWFKKLVNNQSDANLINLPYWELNSNSTSELLKSLGQSTKLKEYTGYDFDNEVFKDQDGEPLNIAEIISGANGENSKNQSNSRVLLGKNGELILDYDRRYYEIPSDRLSNELRNQYNDIFVIKDTKTGMTKEEELKELESDMQEELNRMLDNKEQPSLEFLTKFEQLQNIKKKYSQIINNIGKAINTYTGSKNSNTN